MASALARHPAVMALDRAQCDRLFAAVLRDQPLLLNIVVSDTAGVVKGSGRAVQRGTPVADLRCRTSTRWSRTGKPHGQRADRSGRISNQPTVVLAYPVRDAAGRGGRRARPRPQPDAPADAVQRHPAAGGIGRDADRQSEPRAGAQPRRRAVHRQADRPESDRAARRAAHAGATRRSTASSASTATPSSIAVPGCSASAFRPASRSTRAAPLSRRNLAIVAVAIGAILLLSLGLSTSMTRGVETAARRGAADRRRRSVAAGSARRCRTASSRSCRMRSSHGRQPARDARRARPPGRAGAQDARDAAVAAASGGAPGAARRRRRAGVRRRARAEQPAAGDPRHAGAARAAIAASPPAVLEEIAFVKTQSGRAREIIRNLSRFSSQQSGPPTLVDLREVIDEVVQLRRRDLDTAAIALDVEVADRSRRSTRTSPRSSRSR